MKKLTYLLATAFVALLTACSDYTDAIPAEATLLGRCDLQALQDQTSIDLGKMLSDISEAVQEDNEDFPDLTLDEKGIDLSAPIYLFAAGDMAKAPFLGGVLKVDDRDLLVESVDDMLKQAGGMSKSELKKLKKEEEGLILYQPKGEHFVIGISKEAMLLLVGPESNDRKVRDKAIALLNGEEKGIKDNALYDELGEHDAFASLYVSMDIIPDAAWKELNRELKNNGIQLKTSQLKGMLFGADATASGKVVNVSFWYKAADSDLQEKLDKWAGCFQAPSDKGFQVITSDMIAGFATSFDGGELVSAIPDICSTFGVKTSDIPNYDEVKTILKKFHGNIIGGVTGNEKEFCIVESDNINDLLVQMYAPDFANGNNSSDDYYTSEYSDNLVQNGNEYILEKWWGGYTYFGYKKGFSYYARFDIANNVLDEDADVSSDLASILQANRATGFLSTEAILEQMSRSEREKVETVFGQFFDKVEYVTFSIK